MVTYDDLLSSIVRSQINILGFETAIKFLKDIDGLAVAPNGRVSGGDLKKLELVVDAYIKISGSVAQKFMKVAIKPLLDENTIELPDNLK